MLIIEGSTAPDMFIDAECGRSAIGTAKLDPVMQA